MADNLLKLRMIFTLSNYEIKVWSLSTFSLIKEDQIKNKAFNKILVKESILLEAIYLPIEVLD